jgi:AcrR family transcriptional regulator
MYDSLLQAANRVVLTQGTAHLTLDAVAHEAGVSKGGLLYHFPNKDALVAAMIETLIEHFNADVARVLADDTAPGAWLRAYTRVSFHSDPNDEQVGAALLAAVGTNPDLIEPLRTNTVEWQRQAEQSGVEPVLGTVIRLAVDGLYMNELLGLSRLDPAFREQVMARLIELSKGDKS